jgi:hypothetical protein
MTVTIGATIKYNKQDQNDSTINRIKVTVTIGATIKQNKQDQSFKKLKVKVNYSETHAN